MAALCVGMLLLERRSTRRRRILIAARSIAILATTPAGSGTRRYTHSRCGAMASTSHRRHHLLLCSNCILTWVVSRYMVNPFYAAYTAAYQFSNASAWSDIALQFALMEENARQNATGLLYHGYDESKMAVWADSATGHSPCVWDRALGWFSMALVDVVCLVFTLLAEPFHLIF